MDKEQRHRYWVIWVWIVLGFFLFPLTPPISQNITLQENSLSQLNETPAFMRVKPEAAKIAIPVYIPPAPGFKEDEKPDPSFPLLYVVFVIFLLSRLRELLKKQLLYPLKFTSAYVAPAHSMLPMKF